MNSAESSVRVRSGHCVRQVGFAAGEWVGIALDQPVHTSVSLKKACDLIRVCHTVGAKVCAM
eukprot:2567930-Amphidinium_carterae.1